MDTLGGLPLLAGQRYTDDVAHTLPVETHTVNLESRLLSVSFPLLTFLSSAPVSSPPPSSRCSLPLPVSSIHPPMFLPLLIPRVLPPLPRPVLSPLVGAESSTPGHSQGHLLSAAIICPPLRCKKEETMSAHTPPTAVYVSLGRCLCI